MSEIILSNEQISVARYSENGVIRVNGGPGSGKTLVAVKRAIFLAKDYKYAEKEDKILFLFYNKSLKNTVQKLFDSDENYKEVKDKISKINDEVAEAIYFKNGDKVTLYIFIESTIGLKCVSELSSKYIVSIKTSFIPISF